MIVYRYLESEYLKRFRKEGKIYITTFKKVRSHPNEQLRDESEGEFKLEMKPKHKPECYSDNTMNQIASVHFTQEVGKKAFTVMPNSTAIFKEELEDAYLFCMSSARSKALNEKWNYDAIFEISDVFSFADTMYEELSNTESMIGYIVDEVYYGFKHKRLTPENKDNVLSQLAYDLCLKKPLRFKTEKEWRIVFLSSKPKLIEPHEITCMQLLKFCHFK
jgi:hypothetical protein